MKLLKLSLFAMLLIAITSCNQTNKKMMELIPENSTFVMSINTAKVIEHTGVTVDDNGKVQLPGELKKLVGKNQQEFDKNMAKLTNAGIDPSANIYFYADITDKQSMSFTLLATSKDSEKSKAIFEEEAKKKFEKVGEIDLLKLDAGTSIALKDNIIAITKKSKQGYEESAQSALSKKEKSVLDNDDIAGVLNGNSDINCYLNMESYMKLISEFQPQMAFLSSFYAGMRGTGISIDLSNNEINAKCEVFADDDADVMKLAKEIQGEASSDFLQYMPANAKMIYSASIKGEKLADFAQIKSLLQMATSNQLFGGVDFVDLVKSINGPIAIGLDGDPTSLETTFAGTVVITTSKVNEWKNLFDALLAMSGKSGSSNISVEAKPNAVVIKFGANSDIAYDASKIDEAKSIFNDYAFGFYLNYNIEGMSMCASAYNKNLKHGEGKFRIIGKDGKNMIFGDYPIFFNAIQAKYEKTHQSVYDEPEPDYLEYDSAVADMAYGDSAY